MAGMRRAYGNRKPFVKAAIVGATLTSLEAAELAVGGEHDIALSVGVHSEGISVVQIFA